MWFDYLLQSSISCSFYVGLWFVYLLQGSLSCLLLICSGDLLNFVVMAESPFFGVIPTENMENRSMLQLANENLNTKITNVPLNMTNYIQLSRAVRMYLGGKLLLEYVDKTVTNQMWVTHGNAKWKAYNMMVMSWILNSMETDVSEGLYHLDIANEVWDTLHELYANKKNMAWVYEIKQLNANHKQGDKSASSYCTKLRRYWQELAYQRDIIYHYQKDA